MNWFDQLPTIVRWAIEGLAGLILLVIVLQVITAILMLVAGVRGTRKISKRHAASAKAAAVRRREVLRRHGIDSDSN